jgi:hypothetical protein
VIVELVLELVFVNVTVRAVLFVPASWRPKSKLAGDREIPAVIVPDATPVKPIGCAARDASVATLIAPVSVPFTVGVNPTLMLQVAPGASVAVQLLDWE